MTSFLKPGATFARKYRIVRLLGHGAWGQTYLAEHLLLDGQYVAVKIIHPELRENPEVYARFQREARIAMTLRHPHIIPMWEFDIAPEGHPYYTMEASPGDTLEKFIKREGRFDVLRALRIVRQILDGLAAAHERGVIHRDVKPSNVMIEVTPECEVVRIFDFGLARILGGRKLTASRQILGTPKYMAPEQADPESTRDEPIDGRCDIYSTGVVLFELLAGETPFKSTSPAGYMRKHLLAPVPRLADVAPEIEVPADVEAAVRKAMEKERAARFQTAREFAQEIDRLSGLVLRTRTIESFISQGMPEITEPDDLFLDDDETVGPAVGAEELAYAAPPPRVAAPPSGRIARGESEATSGSEASESAVEQVRPAMSIGTRPRLQVRYYRDGVGRVLHIWAGGRASFGRQRRPEKGQSWDAVPTFVLRYLPPADPEAQRATDSTISRVHFEIAIAAHSAFITDLSSRGTRLGERTLRPGEPTPLGHGDVITPGPGSLALRVSTCRRRRGGEIIALSLSRVRNGETHSYLILPHAAPIGSAAGAALRLDASLDVAPVHAVLYPAATGNHLMIEPCRGAPVRVEGCPVAADGAAPLLPGFRATVGRAPIALAAYFPDSDAALR